MKGLRYYVNKTINGAYSILIEAWLWKKFFTCSVDRTRLVSQFVCFFIKRVIFKYWHRVFRIFPSSITLKSVGGLLPLVNLHMTKQELKQKFLDANGRKLGSQGRMVFSDFTALYNELIHNGNVIRIKPILNPNSLYLFIKCQFVYHSFLTVVFSTL